MNNIENNVNEILDNLQSTGSSIRDIDEFKKEAVSEIKKDKGLVDTLKDITERIKWQTYGFLDEKNEFGTNMISGISTCIYFPDFNGNGEYKLKLIGGSRSRNYDLPIDEDTLFDVASITKLYTLLLAFKLEELGILDLNAQVKDINPDFQNLEDFTLNDLIRLHGELYTNGNVAQATTPEEANRLLHTLYLKSNTREKNTYNDFGAIVIGDTIAKAVSRELGKEMTFEDVMKEYLLKPLNLVSTLFNPTSFNTSGNGDLYDEYGNALVHDRKARTLGGALGHAGIFTTSDDLARLARELYSLEYINKERIARLGEVTFANSVKGNLGVYVKHPEGIGTTFTPSEFSTGSFSHQGWTGSVASFDPNNMIHNNILVNGIYDRSLEEGVKNDKPAGFIPAFEEYERNIVRNIMLEYVVKKYYNKYANDKEDINETAFIR